MKEHASPPRPQDTELNPLSDEAGHGISRSLPDLRVAAGDVPRLQRCLIAAHVGLKLPSGGVKVHKSLMDHVQEHLSGRGATVWHESDTLNMSFGVFSHADQVQVEDFAEAVAQRLGAQVILATTIGMVVPADRGYLQ